MGATPERAFVRLVPLVECPEPVRLHTWRSPGRDITVWLGI